MAPSSSATRGSAVPVHGSFSDQIEAPVSWKRRSRPRVDSTPSRSRRSRRSSAQTSSTSYLPRRASVRAATSWSRCSPFHAEAPSTTYSAAISRPRRAAHWRSSESWLLDSCSSVETRVQMAHRDGINKPYGQDGPYTGRTRGSASRLAPTVCCKQREANSHHLGVTVALLGPVGEVAAGSQGIRVLAAQHPLCDGQQRGELVLRRGRIPRISGRQGEEAA